MKKRWLCALLCLCLILPMMVSCKGKWKGYEDTDLSAYITLGDYKGLTYTKVDTEIDEEALAGEIDKILVDNKEKKEVTDRAAKKDDYVQIDHACKVEAGEIPALSGEDKTYAVGSKYTLSDIPGFADSLIGKSKGDTYIFEFTFPEDYENDKISDISFVAGKAATVEVTVDLVFTYEKPELSDELVKKLSKTATTVEEYKNEIRSALEAERKEKALETMQQQVWDGVLKNATVLAYPESELMHYRENFQSYYEEQSAYYGYTLEEFLKSAYGYTLEVFEQNKEEYAKEQVKHDLVLYALAKAENINVTDAQYAEGLERYFEKQGAELGVKTKEEFEERYTKEVLRSSILWEKVIDFLCESATGVDAPETTAAVEGTKPTDE